MSTTIDKAALDRAVRQFPALLQLVKDFGLDNRYVMSRIQYRKGEIVAEYHRQRQAAWSIKNAEGYWVHSSCGFWGLTDQPERADRFPSKVDADRALERSALPTQIRLLGRVEQIPMEKAPPSRETAADGPG